MEDQHSIKSASLTKPASVIFSHLLITQVYSPCGSVPPLSMVTSLSKAIILGRDLLWLEGETFQNSELRLSTTVPPGVPVEEIDPHVKQNSKPQDRSRGALDGRPALNHFSQRDIPLAKPARVAFPHLHITLHKID